jgi:hypothetical protein
MPLAEGCEKMQLGFTHPAQAKQQTIVEGRWIPFLVMEPV